MTCVWVGYISTCASLPCVHSTRSITGQIRCLPPARGWCGSKPKPCAAVTVLLCGSVTLCSCPFRPPALLVLAAGLHLTGMSAWRSPVPPARYTKALLLFDAKLLLSAARSPLGPPSTPPQPPPVPVRRYSSPFNRRVTRIRETPKLGALASTCLLHSWHCVTHLPKLGLLMSWPGEDKVVNEQVISSWINRELDLIAMLCRGAKGIETGKVAFIQLGIL